MDISLILAIVTIITVFTFFGVLIGRYIYKKIHHLPTGECACCSKANMKKLLKQYHKKYSR